MNSYAVAAAIFVCVLGSALLAMAVNPKLPERHLSAETRDVVKLGIGVVAAMTSLILGLLISSVKTSFDETDQNIRQFSTYIIMLDASLRHFGPLGQAARGNLVTYTRQALDDTWPDDPKRTVVENPKSADLLQQVEDDIYLIQPANQDGKDLKAEVVQIYRNLVSMRWKVIVGNSSTVTPLLVVSLTVWISLIFASFGLFAPHNALSVAALVMCALSIATAMFLIVEMSDPFTGVMSISPAPVRNALAHQLS
ncbi:bestrophin-like domain [Chelatococcus reniformis]|uniref:DUF4239 domain-containing protein n=1 Tax=Chelatococcus reniformis TaxID=1494448 RepID=A0A916XBS6_9HYPH|nr:DUF4239 domain-containing protein [Chelatococcus reniformis]GGC62313.1 hypothetical protein GCM10010994_21110 [Chelatococcus reniformis]